MLGGCGGEAGRGKVTFPVKGKPVPVKGTGYGHEIPLKGTQLIPHAPNGLKSEKKKRDSVMLMLTFPVKGTQRDD